MSSAAILQPGTGRAVTRPARPAGWGPSAVLLLVQGVYFTVTGVWPLVSMDTFLAVTGPKTDLWLVETVGVLIAVIGITLLAGAWRRRAAPEVVLLAMGSALALAGVDVIYVHRQVILPVYLLDAAAEGVLLVAWVLALAWEAFTRWKRSAACL